MKGRFPFWAASNVCKIYRQYREQTLNNGFEFNDFDEWTKDVPKEQMKSWRMMQSLLRPEPKYRLLIKDINVTELA